MIKNKMLLFLYLGIAAQPLLSRESLKKSESDRYSWTSNPSLWRTVGVAGALGLWIYNKYHDYSELQRKKQIIDVHLEKNKSRVIGNVTSIRDSFADTFFANNSKNLPWSLIKISTYQRKF